MFPRVSRRRTDGDGLGLDTHSSKGLVWVPHRKSMWPVLREACGSTACKSALALPGMTACCSLTAVIPGEDPASSGAVLALDNEARGFGIGPDVRPLDPGSALRLPGMTVRCCYPPPSSRAKTRDPLPRSLALDDESRGFGIGPDVRPLDPGSALRLPGMTVRCCYPPPSSRAKTRDPLPRSLALDDESRGFGIGPDVRPLDPGSALRLPGMTVRCCYPPPSSRAETRDPVVRSLALDDESRGFGIGPDVRPLDPGSALRWPGMTACCSLTAVVPGEDPGSSSAADGR